MSDYEDKSPFYREYDLEQARRVPATREPAAHQTRALSSLTQWYESASDHDDHTGGILVLPTGAGKTFTAVHFLCSHPLSEGRKVLWLAHTHHLLEQALQAFDKGVARVTGRGIEQINIRVVSGATGHFKPANIAPGDDVLICSLQTATRAFAKSHPGLMSFLDAAGDELFVVFDEAHHAPATTYRKLIDRIRQRCPRSKLLGMTATPAYSDEQKQGWLKRLFPQGIVAQEDVNALMANGVLARPKLEDVQTSTETEFDDREYRQWMDGVHGDLPEAIIERLAKNQQRNDQIVARYVAGREKYGKTIMFADRWFQCEYLREALRKRGVRAAPVYSHVAANAGSAAARNRRKADDNARTLKDFRNGDLDVLLNIRMLTEGTDVPEAQTVFLTRQTTSRILLTQMVGRALRGPRFGGTPDAYIVSFIDDWKQRIHWATYDQLQKGPADDAVPGYPEPRPLHLVSIELVRTLARQMDSGINIQPAPYTALMPIGWYRVEFDIDNAVDEADSDDADPQNDDTTPVTRLILVFENQRRGFGEFLKMLETSDIEAFEPPDVRLAEVRSVLDGWKDLHFEDANDHVGADLLDDLLDIARHMAQNERVRPRFYPFEAREQHDLDKIAQGLIEHDYGPRKIDQVLQAEYSRTDRYWNLFYPAYDQFASASGASIRRLLHADRHGEHSDVHRPTFTIPEEYPQREASEETKREVKRRDRWCLCCGSGRRLQIDHVSPRYLGLDHRPENLQTLCRVCNRLKSDRNTIDFRHQRTLLTTAPPEFPDFEDFEPPWGRAKDPFEWEIYLRRCVNFYYQRGAVEEVEIGQRGEGLRTWQIWLFQGNDPAWLAPHLPHLATQIREVREYDGLMPAPDQIVIAG